MVIFSPKSVPGSGSLPFFIVQLPARLRLRLAEMTPAGIWIETDVVGDSSHA